MKKLEDYLAVHADADGDRVAVVCGGDSVTYSQLYASVTERASELAKCEGRAMVVRSSQTIDFLITYFACHIAGKVIVPLERDIPDIRFLEIESIVSGSEIPDEVADILFTTGTTGMPKGTMISHLAVISNAENLIDAQGFDSDVTFVISGPLNHIGSLSKIWPMIVVGGTIIVTDGMKDIDAFLNALDYPAKKIATFLVPASICILMQFAKDRLPEYSSKIDFIETGAAPMVQSDMEKFSALLPKTRLYNTYASTETGIISTHDYCHDGCIAGCLGRPMKHATIIITSEGAIACRGPMLMSGYVGDLELTNKILRDNTLYTSDLGYIDDNGRLRLNGRADDVINVGGYKVQPTEVEDAVKAFPGIADCICVCDEHPVIGNVLKLIYVVSDGADFSQASMIKYLKNNLEAYKVPFFYEKSSKIQRTYNGKLDRKFYRKK